MKTGMMMLNAHMASTMLAFFIFMDASQPIMKMMVRIKSVSINAFILLGRVFLVSCIY